MIKSRQKSTTDYPITFLMVDDSDHITGKTGLTPSVTLSKDGSSFAAAGGAVSEIGNGWYKLAGNATDRNTLGELLIHAAAAGADPTDLIFNIVDYDPFAFGYTLETKADGIKSKTDALPATPAAKGDEMKLEDGTITASKIASSAITAAKLDSNVISATKIASNAITAAKIADGAITDAKIQDGAITSAKIADNAIANAKLADGAISAAKLADGAITSAKIADNAITAYKIAEDAINKRQVAQGVYQATADFVSPVVVDRVSKFITGAFPDIVVAGSGEAQVNGTYVFTGMRNDRPRYFLIVDGVNTEMELWWNQGEWTLSFRTYDPYYRSFDDVPTPDLCTTWSLFDGNAPVPTVTAAPDTSLYAQLAAIRGAGWTSESLKAIADAIDLIDGGLDAAGVRAAVGLAAANLDAQLSGIASDAGDVESRLTSARAGYIDKLNVAGTLANTNNADTFKADVSGLMTAAAYTAPNNADISAIKAKTDNLPNNPAATSDIPAADITAIKAKTDNLPATPAAKGDEMKLENGAITAAKIATDAITADKIAYAAITVNKIQDGAITANKIASNAIAAAKIADGAITGDKVAASAVTKIQSGLAVPGSAMTLTSAYDNAKDDVLTPLATVDGKADAIKAKTDNLPGSPAATGDKMMLDTNALDAAAIKADAVTKLQANLALEATLTAIKGAGWSTETLKAIKDAVDAIDPGGGGGGATAQEVWEYATRSLSNPNDYKADLTSVEGKVDAIKAKTDNLPVSPAATGDIPAADIAAIKAKTDNIPNSPAAAGDAMTLTSAYDHAKDDVLTPLGVTDGKVDAIKTKTDNLPNNPAAKTDIPTADISAIKAKTDNLPLSPAATGDAMTLDGAYDHAKDDVLTPLFNLDGKVSGLNDIDSAEVKAQIDAALHTDKLPDSYSVVGAQPSIAQALLEIRQWLTQKNIVGITMTVKKPDGTTDAMTFGLDDPANPTKIVRLS